MARAGTQRWRNPAPEGDDVQRSIELLDKVLSEYDEHEVEGEGGGCGGGGGGGVATTTTATTDCSSSTEPSIGLTPDDESPSLGHQSEDDGYMSMNGRKAKMALVALRPVPDCPEPQDSTGAPAQEFPPPPEEAERIISTLLPMVSPGNSSKRGSSQHQQQQQQQQQQSGRRAGSRQQWIAAMEDCKRPAHAVTTQTTLPKTRHQRPYGWENGGDRVNQHHQQQPNHQQQQQQYVVEPFHLAEPPSPPSKFASLPYDGKVSFNWIPPRSREQQPLDNNVKKQQQQSSEDGLEELRQSSEDGLDEEDEVDDEDEEADVDEDEDDDDEEEDDESNHPSPEKERAASARNNHHHHHHHHHPGSRRPPRQTEITKSSSVEDRLLMNNHASGRTSGQHSNGSSSNGKLHRLNNGGSASAAGSSSSRRRRNNSDSSEGRFSRAGSESESRSSMPRSSSVSVERFSMRANCDSSDFSRANSTSNERFHSDFSIAVASTSSNDHVSVPTSDPFLIRNLDFVSFSLPHAASSERFSGRTSDRCSEERYSEIFSTRNSDFSTRNSTDFRTQSEEEHFSDDSLEELLPPPPALSKRHSIAWEVPLDDDPLYAPGSTKVVGRRRRKSSDISSVGSASKLRDFDDWQDPRVSTTDDDLISPYSDSSTNELDQLRPQDLSKNGTYVIRRGRKKERKQLPKSPSKSLDEDTEDSRLTEVRRFSNTFDNIKSLLKENSKLEGLQEPPPEFGNSQAVSQPDLAGPRAASLERKEKRKSTHRETEASLAEQKLPEEEQEQQEDEEEEEEPVKITSFAERTRECNGFTITSSKSLDVSKAANLIVDEVPARRSMNEQQHRLEAAKIPVNLLIEDQIVKKALNENRRQLEKVSDAIKEIESVKNSVEFGSTPAAAASTTTAESKRNGDARMGYNKRFSLSKERPERKLLDVSEYDCRQPNRRQPPQPPPHAVDVTDALVKDKESSFDRRRINGEEIYSSGRRPRHPDLENLKNDTKQIENVIDAILEDSKNPDFQVNVDVLEFPPLPPSPVEEADEESSDVGGSGCNGSGPAQPAPGKSKPGHTNRTMEYRPRVPPHRGISLDSSTKEHQTTSLNTRSMDAGYSRGRRTAAGIANARREVPVERRTLPTDLPGPSRRRPFTKRHSPSTEACSSSGSGGTSNGGGGTVGNNGTGMQTSCSLPETPVFARGSDIPRTPQHASGAAGTAGNPTQPRRQPGWYAPTTATTGYRRNNPGLEQAIIGTELLRLAGGPNRGWYPTRKSNQPRPASIEHLERLNSAYDARLPGAAEQRKPLTLPTNITPNKYFGQSKHSSTSSTREALRRVTSLLIKKGGGSKDGKSGKDNLSPSGPYAGVEATDAPKKKGFFKNFWKRSRHYSLENQ